MSKQADTVSNFVISLLQLIGPQFLFAIEPILNNHWTPEVEAAWSDLFKFIAYVMREAMML